MKIHRRSVRQVPHPEPVRCACILLLGLTLSGVVFAESSLTGNTETPALAVDEHITLVSSLEPPHQTRTLPVTEARGYMNWAIYLSDYKDSTKAFLPPEVRFETQAFFVSNACGGRQSCKVLGWYADRGVIHVHERLAEMRTLFASSLVVHEMVHYLQQASGRFAANDCEAFVQREIEAYAVQQAYYVAYGAMPNIQIHQYACPEEGEVLLVGR